MIDKATAADGASSRRAMFGRSRLPVAQDRPIPESAGNLRPQRARAGSEPTLAPRPVYESRIEPCVEVQRFPFRSQTAACMTFRPAGAADWASSAATSVVPVKTVVRTRRAPRRRARPSRADIAARTPPRLMKAATMSTRSAESTSRRISCASAGSACACKSSRLQEDRRCAPASCRRRADCRGGEARRRAARRDGRRRRDCPVSRPRLQMVAHIRPGAIPLPRVVRGLIRQVPEQRTLALDSGADGQHHRSAFASSGLASAHSRKAFHRAAHLASPFAASTTGPKLSRLRSARCVIFAWSSRSSRPALADRGDSPRRSEPVRCRRERREGAMARWPRASHHEGRRE